MGSRGQRLEEKAGVMPNDIVLGAKQIRNPKGIKPRLDSDVSSNRKPATRGYVSMNSENYHEGDSKMDISNPPQSGIVPHPMEKLFEKPEFRHQPGQGIPKDHPAIQETEN